MSEIILFNKPCGVLCQFSAQEGHQTLADYIDIPNVYPAGRLDADSEGLLILTDDGHLQARISHPKHKLAKTYWVQVEGEPDDAALEQLRRGIALKDGPTLPAEVERLCEPQLWPRHPPIRERRNIPTSWLSIVLREGRNRQVRRMTAAVGYPTLRLVRVRVGPWSIDGIAAGEFAASDIRPAEPARAPVDHRSPSYQEQDDGVRQHQRSQAPGPQQRTTSRKPTSASKRPRSRVGRATTRTHPARRKP